MDRHTITYLLLVYIVCFISFVYSQISLKYTKPTCQYDSDCIANGYCRTNECFCKDGFLPIQNKQGNLTACLKEAVTQGDRCTDDIQCTAAFGSRAECFNKSENTTGTCQCTTNAHFQDKICYPTVWLGEHCKSSGECKTRSNISSYCDIGTCVCPYHYHPNEDGTDCLPSSHIGDPCRNDKECVAKNSRCSDVCRCALSYIPSIDGKRCLHVGENIGAVCEEDGQCQVYLKNSACDSNTKECLCAPTAHYKDGICWNTAGLGESCNDTRECLISSHTTKTNLLTCSNGTCQCVNGLKPLRSSNDCVAGFSPQKSSSVLLTIISLFIIILLRLS